MCIKRQFFVSAWNARRAVRSITWTKQFHEEKSETAFCDLALTESIKG
jgi:hypothetical protein